MSTIAEKLNYLNDTRLKIKDGLNKFGADLTENDTFRSYSNVLNDIYDKLPKVSGNGSNFTLESVQKGKLDLFEMEGNTEQQTYTGKNLLNITNSGETKNGVTYKKNEDGSITLNGTATANTHIVISTQQITQPNTYSFGVTTDISSYGNQLECGGYIYNSDNSFKYNLSTRAGRTPRTISNGEYIANFFIYFTTGRVFNNLTLYPQLEIGSTFTSFEPFVGGSPSPSPDYPQDIKVVTGDNTINVHGKNLFDKDNVNTLNSYISLGNGKITSSNADKCLYIPIKSNTTYTISKILSSRFVIGCTDELPVVNTTICNPISGNQATNTTYTITSGNNSQYLVVFYYTTSDTLTEQEILDSIQIEENPTATEYQPYQSKDYEISLGDIELCKIGNYQDKIYKSNGKWYLHKEIGKGVLDGSEEWNKNINYSTSEMLVVHSLISNAKTGSVDIANYFKYASPTIINSTRFASQYLLFGLDINNFATVGDFKTWLSTHNTTVYYVLATPTNTEITDTTLIEQLEEIETETGTNIFEVSSDNAVLPSLNVKRLKELEKLS